MRNLPVVTGNRGAAMERPEFDVVGIGCSAVDYLGIVPRYPEADVKMQMLDLVQQGGGLAATAMVTVARLGGRSAYVGKVGDDALGKFVIGELEREGVSTKYTVIRKGGSARFAFVLVDKENGTRTIVWSQKGVEHLGAEELPKEAIFAAKVLLVDEYEPEAAVAAARLALKAGVRAVLDAERVSDVTKELVQLCHTVIVPARFALDLTGEGAQGAREPRESEILSAGRSMRAGRAVHADRGEAVVLTAGAQGAYYFGANEEFYQPAFSVEVVDTTGAGDVFHGAFAYGLSRGWIAGEVVQFASAVAALKCRKLGGRTGIPALNDAIRFLAERAGGAWTEKLRNGGSG